MRFPKPPNALMTKTRHARDGGTHDIGRASCYQFVVIVNIAYN